MFIFFEHIHWLFIEKRQKWKKRTKKERKIHENLVVVRKLSSARLRRVFAKVFSQNFEEYLSQNLQFRKALIIILTILLGGSFTQGFEEHLFLFLGIIFYETL